eukprot:scaffold29180_cov140-Isochrysis_galbana.AAC.3
MAAGFEPSLFTTDSPGYPRSWPAGVSFEARVGAEAEAELEAQGARELEEEAAAAGEDTTAE